MSIYRLFNLPPINDKLPSFTANKRSINDKSVNHNFKLCKIQFYIILDKTTNISKILRPESCISQ